MELYQLRTFVTVAQHGHLTQAAEQLHLSQPAVTAQIKALEEDVGMPLFERVSGGVVLTRAGQVLLPGASQILDAARELLNQARSLKGQLSGPARIGLPLTPDILRLGPWIAGLARDYPLLGLQLHYGVTGEVLNLVRKRELEAGFFLGRNPYANVETIHLADLPFVVATPPGWAGRVTVPRDLGKLPWLGVSQFSGMSRALPELWRALNISPQKITESDDMPTQEALVRAGVGVALLLDSTARSLAERGLIDIVPGITKHVPLQFVYASDKAGDPVVDALCAALREIWPRPEGEKHES